MILKGSKIRVPLLLLFAVYIKVLLRLTTEQKKRALYIYIYFFFYQITYLLKGHQFWPEHRPSLNVLQHHHEYLHELSANNKLNIIIFIIVIKKTASCILSRNNHSKLIIFMNCLTGSPTKDSRRRYDISMYSGNQGQSSYNCFTFLTNFTCSWNFYHENLHLHSFHALMAICDSTNPEFLIQASSGTPVWEIVTDSIYLSEKIWL